MRKSRTHPALTVLAAVVVVAALVAAYRWYFSDERAIRGQLAAIATALTIPPDEGNLGPVTRVARLRKLLAADIRLTAGSQEIASRDAVLALAGRATAPPGGLTVAFDDVQVKVADDRASAGVSCTAKISGRNLTTGEPTADARALTVGFRKDDGVWVVNAVRTEEETPAR